MSVAVHGAVGVAPLLILAVTAYGASGPWWRRIRHRRERDDLRRLTEGAPRGAVDAEPVPLERRVRAAGLTGPPVAYVLAAGALAAGLGLLIWRVVPAVPFGWLLGASLGLYLPWTTLVGWAKRRSHRFEQRLIDAIDLMTATLQSGGTLTQALRAAGAASEPPLRGEFEEAVRRLTLGMPVDRAFRRMAERYDGEGVRLFVLTLAAKQQVGGDLTPVLRALNETLRDRSRQQRQVRAQLAGTRVSAFVVAALPYVLVPLLWWLLPEWFVILIRHPLGPPLLFVAVLVQIAGLLWLRRILSREL